MSSNWKTLAVPLQGGLDLQKSHFRLSQEQPGSAFYLSNFEIDPNREGYHRIKGYTKFSEVAVPDGGAPDSLIKGVYAFGTDTVVVNRNKEVYTGSGTTWTKRTASSLSNESVKMKGVSYLFTGNRKTMFVDGANDPYYLDQTTLSLTQLSSPPSDVSAATSVIVFKNRLWFAKNSILTYTAPNTDDDFSALQGAGTINAGDTIKGLGVYRDSLIIFLVNGLKQIEGSTSSDFVLKDFFGAAGCVDGDTIQNIFGDLVYLSYDGIRFISDSDRSTGFTLSASSRKLGNSLTDKIPQFNQYTSCIVNSKNQYRIFFYDEDLYNASHFGFCGTQMGQQSEPDLWWTELRGFKCFSCSYSENSNVDFIVFSNDQEYVYQMESGSSFDGENISWAYWSPYLFFEDPIKRKTVYNVYYYGSLSERTEGYLSVKIDFQDPRVIQPATSIQAIGENIIPGEKYGQSFYGSAIYGGLPLQNFSYTNVGNGCFFSFRLYGEGIEEPFTLDTIVFEYSLKDRQ
jgi:hypothetical protein